MSVRCVSSPKTANNARYVQTQCMLCATRSSKSTSSLVCLFGELLVVVRVVPVFLNCDAVVHRIHSHSCIP